MSSIETFTPVAPETPALRGFFDRISARYDFLNQLLSFRLDEAWRKKSRAILLSGQEESILDLGTGTGKFLELFLQAKKWKRAAGLDFSEGMLRTARKSDSHFLRGQAEFIRGDFQALPFSAASFDLVISAFTLRSVQNMAGFLKEISRVLTSNGKAGFLCLTRPQNPFFNLLYYPYLKFYLPWIGGLISGDRHAYKFLADSILNFQESEQTAGMMREAGFKTTRIFRFTFGIATLIVGEK